MNCPNCGTTLQMADRSGVEIDYCPSCRGVWLDKGELDKIIEQSQNQMGQGSYGQPAKLNQAGNPGQPTQQTGPVREERRESWLETIFDIFD